jgi:hypothetical protein
VGRPEAIFGWAAQRPGRGEPSFAAGSRRGLRTGHEKATDGSVRGFDKEQVRVQRSGVPFKLVARINDPCRAVYVRFVGTDEEYDAIDVETI